VILALISLDRMRFGNRSNPSASSTATTKICNAYNVRLNQRLQQSLDGSTGKAWKEQMKSTVLNINSCRKALWPDGLNYTLASDVHGDSQKQLAI